MVKFKMFLLVVLSLVVTACEKMVIDEQTSNVKEEQGNVIIRAQMYDIVPFSQSRAVQPLSDYCTKLCFVVYQDGEQKKKVLQKRGDDGYGEVSISLAAGTYQLLVLGHSSTNNPSLTHPEKIQFKNADGFTDTFYYYGDLEVTDMTSEHDITMQRASSMLRIIITDEAPTRLSRLRIYYTGESGVFNAVTGWGGDVDSRQYIFYDVAGQTAPFTLEAYTFLRGETGKLQAVVTAYDANDVVIAEKELSNIPMKNCMVTEYVGTLFTDAAVRETTFTLHAETAWPLYGRWNF